MNRADAFDDIAPRRNILAACAMLIAFGVYAAAATFSTLVYPPTLAAFLAPLAAVIVAAAPRARPAPRRLALTLIYVAAVLLPLWPVFLHLKIGPAPILTPPRLVLYALTAVWVFDMACSRIRRGRLAHAVRNAPLIVWPALAFFALGALSVPLAEGRMLALGEFFRQSVIWLAPFLAVLTYVRSGAEARRIFAILAVAGGVSGAIAVVEIASGRLMASALSPLIADNADWLRKAQEQKIRDGVFRAQGPHTHPLSLGELLAMTAPLALGFAVSARAIRTRIMWSLCLAFIAAGAVATNSRGAMLAIAVAMTAACALLAWRQLRKTSSWRFRPAAGLVAALALAASPLVAAGALHVISGGAGESAARSTQSRIDQIEMAAPMIADRPVLGHGAGRAARVLGYWGASLTIDNYYLTLALDYGLPGPFVFLSMLIGFGWFALDRAGRAPPQDAALWTGLAAAAAALVVTRTIVSMTGNMAIIFFMLAVAAGARGARPPKGFKN